MVRSGDLTAPASGPLGGAVTFLFTDVEGSTQRWERDRDAMGDALRRHDAVLRDAVESHGGEVFKTIGDAFCAAFVSAAPALEAALAAQRALSREDFSDVDGMRVRMALHSGLVEARGGDYFGPAVNRVARLLAIGHGGQVLISSAVADALGDRLPASCSLRDMGAHQLKDLAHPERVFQLVAPDLPDAFPALRSLGSRPNNLPRELTTLVGRDAALAEIRSLVLAHPLVTIVATGGVGKTRCAIRAGYELLDDFPDGIWFVDLSVISEPAAVAPSVMRALRLSESSNKGPIDVITQHLCRKRALLILDNCEHVIEEAGAMARAILGACPDVRVIATSRERLHVGGEAVCQLPPLEVPAADADSAALASASSAVRLFVERAVAVDARFVVTDRNARSLTEISRRLDGIPLAIELAAARINVLSPADLTRRLDERFRLLSGGDRSALPRHQTMRGLIDWSHDLLDARERSVFRSLSIFAGGFTADAACRVCASGDVDELAVIDLVGSLVDKSLVQSEGGVSRPRMRMLESTRQYAAEQLAASGEYDAVAHAHAVAFLAFADEQAEIYDREGFDAWKERALPELENGIAALRWALGDAKAIVLGQRLAIALNESWTFLAPADGRKWIALASSRVDQSTPPDVRAFVTAIRANDAANHNDYAAAYAAAAEAMELYRDVSAPRNLAWVMRLAGCSLAYLGRLDEGEALLRRALERARELGMPAQESAALRDLATARSFAGDFGSAMPLFAEAFDIAKRANREHLLLTIGANLAEMQQKFGDTEGALRSALEALEPAKRFGVTMMLGRLHCNIAGYLIALERYDEAESHARTALIDYRESASDLATQLALQHLATVMALRAGSKSGALDDARRAARVLGYVDRRAEANGTIREPTEARLHDRTVTTLRRLLSDEELSRLLEEGAAMDFERAAAEVGIRSAAAGRT
jgi:predicted ATPase/class 3 adenylate cyclase